MTVIFPEVHIPIQCRTYDTFMQIQFKALKINQTKVFTLMKLTTWAADFRLPMHIK